MIGGDYLDEREASRFVGRDAELARLDRLLRPDPPAPVVLVHGPGGIGKSTLLREVARRARRAGLTVHRVDGRDHAGAQEALSTALAALAADGPGLLVFDTYEAATALGAPLRSGVRPLLGAGTRVLVAGRRPPESAWREDGWPEAVLSLELRPLPGDEARELVRRRGLDDVETTGRVASWADGSPLALSVATDALLAGHAPDLDRLDADDLLASTLLQRLTGDELDGADREVLAVAAIALAVDARMLAAVLPDVDGDHAEAWLRSRSFSERVGTRVTLHEAVRRAVRATLTSTDPVFVSELRRRIADHLYARSLTGELRLLIDLAELVEDETVRWGIAPPPVTHRGDRARPGDATVVAERLSVGDEPWWPGLRRWFDEAPEAVMVVHDAQDAIVGYGVAVSPGSAPEWAPEDPVLGPWLADAATRIPDGNVFLLREARVFPADDDPAGSAAATATGNHALVLGSGLATVRAIYAGGDPDNTEQMAFLRAVGYRPLEHLDVRDGGRRIACMLRDFGPGGMAAWFRDLVYASVDVAPPSTRTAAVTAPQVVRDALRSFHDPAALAVSPLARGVGTTERAHTVRVRLERAASAAFGASGAEQLQATVLRRGYLDADGGHQRAMLELHMSRTTYFRRLARAADRVAAHVLADANG